MMTLVLHEADVGDTYNARGVQFTCKLCSFFELCNEAVIVWWRTMAADLRFDCDLNAPLESILSKHGQQGEKTNQFHDCNSGFEATKDRKIGEDTETRATVIWTLPTNLDTALSQLDTDTAPNLDHDAAPISIPRSISTPKEF
jgi:hypothetical protein